MNAGTTRPVGRRIGEIRRVIRARVLFSIRDGPAQERVTAVVGWMGMGEIGRRRYAQKAKNSTAVNAVGKRSRRVC